MRQQVMHRRGVKRNQPRHAFFSACMQALDSLFVHGRTGAEPIGSSDQVQASNNRPMKNQRRKRAAGNHSRNDPPSHIPAPAMTTATRVVTATATRVAPAIATLTASATVETVKDSPRLNKVFRFKSDRLPLSRLCPNIRPSMPTPDKAGCNSLER
jgi:hypothetical protein